MLWCPFPKPTFYEAINTEGEPVPVVGSSYEAFEQQDIEGLIDNDTLDDLINGKELMQIAIDHFGGTFGDRLNMQFAGNGK